MAIRDLSRSSGPGRVRVAAEVDGDEVWFESDDADLEPSGEAFGTAFLIPALHAGRRLSIDAPTDGQWARNVIQLVDTVGQWWGTPPCLPAAVPSRPRPRASGTGLFFTGGVDSFFSLLESHREIDYLVHVQGFDIPMSDRDRMMSAEADARSVAEAMGRKCLVVRTNLRSHPAYETVSWERTHGGALVTIAHLLRKMMGEVVISSSGHRSVTRPWGSDHRIDRWWSSSALVVTHFGEDWWRHEKLEQIAAHPLVRRYLRVCWEHRSPAANCSQCDKCVRTMLTLSRIGALETSPRFEAGPIAELIDALPVAHGPGNRREYGIMMEQEQNERIRRALADLLARSPEPSPVAP